MNPLLRSTIEFAAGGMRAAAARLRRWAGTPVYFGRSTARVPAGSLVLFPLRDTCFGCGIAGIVAFKRPADPAPAPAATLAEVERLAARVQAAGFAGGSGAEARPGAGYLGGDEVMEPLWQAVQELKRHATFGRVFADPALQSGLERMAAALGGTAAAEARHLEERIGHLPAADADRIGGRIERLRDIAWSLKSELLDNVLKVRELLAGSAGGAGPQAVRVFRDLNAVLNSIDRMEVRGRDSAGVSVLVMLSGSDFGRLNTELAEHGLASEFAARSAAEPLLNRGISVRRDAGRVCLAFTYKVAREIGSLGDNIRFLRGEIATDALLHRAVGRPLEFHTINAHTRWASVGAITEANCHPVDNRVVNSPAGEPGVIHTCLNGDIDNFQELREVLERAGRRIHAEVTTDTKIIPLQVEHHLRKGVDVLEAFRLAVCDFKGSHAIAMHTDLAPGKLFLAQRGSGQAIFVGIAPDHYMATSEAYGFIEETQAYVKLDGESVVEGRSGKTQGQIFILSQDAGGGVEGLQAMRYDGTPLTLGPGNLKRTALTSRDIDRQSYPHYFLKEISESPASVEKTLQNRWKIRDEGRPLRVTALDERVIPERVNRALKEGAIRRVYFIGQGTAGVAALACANLLSHYLRNPSVNVQALKASEFSGFVLQEEPDAASMADALVVAISQSGTTTDTNRSVDMVRQRGAYALAIVNRRDSDLTFKVDGVMYTSSGRDIEMSVASTKAFYAQITAGALLGLHLAHLMGSRDADFVSAEIDRLLALPAHMRRVLAMADRIRASAKRLAVTKTYWAAVGSGPNKASADEIRIKLSELCYKTISSDYVEDKKHIDLSSEPLILVCAAGARASVVGDLVKDTAIFKAHKATPVVICDEGEDRFDAYAADVFQVPVVGEHLAPVLNTLVGHLWGYHAALSIHDGSRFLYRFHADLEQTVAQAARDRVDTTELVLDTRFREKVAAFYTEFRGNRACRQFSTAASYDAASDLTLLSKYLTGRLPASDFELDFSVKGTAANMLQTLLTRLAEAIGFLARPVDAIKHQAKTVTVGTSRISERVEGLVFAALAAEGFTESQLTPANLIVLKNVQGVIREIEGVTLYRIAGLNLLGEPDDQTTIQVVHKRGPTAAIPSRVETDATLKGTKRIIVRQGNVYIGKGRKDDRSILIIPLLSAEASRASRVDRLLLLHVGFKESVPLTQKVRALGGKYEHIKNIVQENSLRWEDALLEAVPIDDLFGRSAEKVAESIVARVKVA
jgi:glutamine---fructose-6-phosphate transaminase (isomerizing)